VRTIGGMVGEVVEVTDEHVVIETTPGTRLKFVKSAVAGVIPPAEPELEQAEESEQDGESEPAEAAAEHAEPSDAAPAAEAGAAGTDAESDGAEHGVASEPAKR